MPSALGLKVSETRIKVRSSGAAALIYRRLVLHYPNSTSRTEIAVHFVNLILKSLRIEMSR